MVNLTEEQKIGLSRIIAQNFKIHLQKNTKNIYQDELTHTIMNYKNYSKLNKSLAYENNSLNDKKKDNDNEKKSSNAMGIEIYKYLINCLKDVRNNNVLELKNTNLRSKFSTLDDDILTLIIKKLILCNTDDELELPFKNQNKMLTSDNPPEIRQDQIDILCQTTTFKQQFAKFIDPQTETINNVTTLDSNTKKLINRYLITIYKKKIFLIRISKQKLIAECCINTNPRLLLQWLNENHTSNKNDKESIIPNLIKKLASHYKMLTVPKIQQDNFDKAFNCKHIKLTTQINILNEMSMMADYQIYKLPYNLDFFTELEILDISKFNKHKRSTNNIEVVSLQNDYKIIKTYDVNNAHYLRFERKTQNSKEFVFDYISPPNATKEELVEFNKKSWAERMIEYDRYAKLNNFDCEIVAPYQIDLVRVYMLMENNNMNKTNDTIKYIKTGSTGIGSLYKYINKDNKEKESATTVVNDADYDINKYNNFEEVIDNKLTKKEKAKKRKHTPEKNITSTNTPVYNVSRVNNTENNIFDVSYEYDEVETTSNENSDEDDEINLNNIKRIRY
ncbi:hypothetical protein TONV_004 [Tipula oleracea nudivirus]|uniref:Uncharacterized protein n=1 Tax=Tipula oleracea nudivirus TaxID=1546257 RepID=A0A0B4VFJ1_9VIRU|nr:hypothetical protein TONV_004 [Tipula oleracea nudivirus]AJD20064.1 hypothetical protein TONV_004 [Tipula oleracea nudivirus]